MAGGGSVTAEREYYWGPLTYLFTFPALGGLLFGYDIVNSLFLMRFFMFHRVQHHLSLNKSSLVIILVRIFEVSLCFIFFFM